MMPTSGIVPPAGNENRSLRSTPKVMPIKRAHIIGSSQPTVAVAGCVRERIRHCTSKRRLSLEVPEQEQQQGI